jgi:hypothetical protein
MANYLIPMIDAYRSFTLIQYILEYSCYGTIATKYKSTIFKIFLKYGKPGVASLLNSKFPQTLKIKIQLTYLNQKF